MSLFDSKHGGPHPGLALILSEESGSRFLTIFATARCALAPGLALGPAARNWAHLFTAGEVKQPFSWIKGPVMEHSNSITGSADHIKEQEVHSIWVKCAPVITAEI